MKKYTLIFVILFFIPSSQAADTTYGNIVASRLTGVYDGDTFYVDIDSFPPIVGKNIPIRIYGVDTPEIRGTRTRELADRAKFFAMFKLENAEVIELRNMRRGKYFRIIAEVWVDGTDLGKLLIDNGLAKPYFGGPRPRW